MLCSSRGVKRGDQHLGWRLHRGCAYRQWGARRLIEKVRARKGHSKHFLLPSRRPWSVLHLRRGLKHTGSASRCLLPLTGEGPAAPSCTCLHTTAPRELPRSNENKLLLLKQTISTDAVCLCSCGTRQVPSALSPTEADVRVPCLSTGTFLSSSWDSFDHQALFSLDK